MRSGLNCVLVQRRIGELEILDGIRLPHWLRTYWSSNVTVSPVVVDGDDQIERGARET